MKKSIKKLNKILSILHPELFYTSDIKKYKSFIMENKINTSTF